MNAGSPARRNWRSYSWTVGIGVGFTAAAGLPCRHGRMGTERRDGLPVVDRRWRGAAGSARRAREVQANGIDLWHPAAPSVGEPPGPRDRLAARAARPQRA